MSASISTPRTTSLTAEKQRDCCPSPNTRIGSSAQRADDHVRDHHAVGAGLARTARVEAPDDHDRQLALLPVGLSQAFVHGLAARVRPTQLVRRAHDAIVVLGERHRDALAVHLAAREHHRLALACSAHASRTTSVPRMLVIRERSGFSRTYLTPTAAAKWNTRSHCATSPLTSAESVTLPSRNRNWGWRSNERRFSSAAGGEVIERPHFGALVRVALRRDGTR